MLQRLALCVALTSLFLVSTQTTSRAEDKAESKKAGKKPGVIAHIRLAGELDETPVVVDPLFGSSGENFKSKIDRIRQATKDDNVEALLIHVDGLEVGWAKVAELRQALEEFRKTGKKTYAYLDSAESKDYLVASGCEFIAIPESGSVVVVGVRAEVTFYKELLDKLGIKAEFIAMGVFKSFAEPYTRTKMSDAARSQLKLVVDDYFALLTQTISKSRSKVKDLSADKVAKIIDEGPFSAGRAKALGLIDYVSYLEDFEDAIKKDLGKHDVKVVRDYGMEKAKDVDLSNPFTLLKQLFGAPKSNFRAGKDRIALIYAVGAITTGKSSRSLFGGESVGSTTIIEAIRKAEADPKVKAIVLRVDSPGGSALASDLIWREIKRCKKPVIASMSDVAASGGYYISMGARKIYAEPGTLTGSIGVVGGKIALSGLYDKVGITTETVARGTNAGIFSSTEPFTASERKAMEKMMEETYDQFLSKAIAGREAAGKKFTRKQMVDVAEGRIWTGRQALDRGLVDALGSLEDAIAEAKQLGGLARDADVDYLILPKAKSFLDSLLDKAEGASSFSLPKGLTSFADLGRHLRTYEMLHQLRSEHMLLMLPHSLQVK